MSSLLPCSSHCVGFSMICLVCEAKVFHVFFFAHFSTASLHCTTVRSEPPEVVRNYNALDRLHTRVGVRRRLEWGVARVNK